MTTLLLDLWLSVVLVAMTISSSKQTAVADDKEPVNWSQCDCVRDDLLAGQLSLQDDVCDSWLPRFNVTKLTTLCRERNGPPSLLTAVCGDVSTLCAHAECQRHESVLSTLEFVCNSTSVAVYTANVQCLHSDELRQRLHSVCNTLLINSSAQLGTVGFSDTTPAKNQCRKCDVTERCVSASVRSVCGDDAADWLTQVLYHVRAPYVTCWRCSHSDAGNATPIPRYRVSGLVSVVPCACALLFSVCVLYVWRVYRRRYRYVKTRLQEASVTIYVTADDQSQTDNVCHTDTEFSVETDVPESPTGDAELVDGALLPFIYPSTTTRRP